MWWQLHCSTCGATQPGTTSIKRSPALGILASFVGRWGQLTMSFLHFCFWATETTKGNEMTMWKATFMPQVSKKAWMVRPFQENNKQRKKNQNSVTTCWREKQVSWRRCYRMSLPFSHWLIFLSIHGLLGWLPSCFFFSWLLFFPLLHSGQPARCCGRGPVTGTLGREQQVPWSAGPDNIPRESG